MRVVQLSGLWLVALSSSCSISDEDRCADGYTWEEELLSCRKISMNNDTESSGDTDVDTDQDAGVDSGTDAGIGSVTDTDVEMLPEGMDQPCTPSGSECEAYPEANHCLTDPRNPDAPGVCTIPDCEPGGCPAEYLCCNCFTIIVNCMSETAAEAAITEGCSCS